MTEKTVSSFDRSIRGLKKSEATPLSRKIEAFALDLAHLIRGVHVYPDKHPTPSLESPRTFSNPLPSMSRVASPLV